MKTTITALFAALLLAPAAARAAAGPFQGVLEGRMYGPHARGTTRTLVSPDGLRNEVQLEHPAAQASGKGKLVGVSLYRSAEPDRVYRIDPAAKTYRIERPGAGRAEPDRGWKVERRGKGEVAGLPCESASLTSAAGDRIDVCVSLEIGRGAPWLRALQQGDAGAGAGSARALAEAGLAGFPLRWVLQTKGGATALTLEVTSARRRAVAAAELAPPEGLEEQRAK